MKIQQLTGVIAILFAFAPLAAIATPFKPVVNNPQNSSVVAKPIYKIGKPYTVKGISYTPQVDEQYDEIGYASWYGGEFHGRLTSNGEIFNKDLVTAASGILPLPSIVEITNLSNGKKILARVNDRGPYSAGRIIDVSEKAAELLGFKEAGVAKVRVTLIPDLSLEVAKQMPNYSQVVQPTADVVGNREHNIMQPTTTLAQNVTDYNSVYQEPQYREPVDNNSVPFINVNQTGLKQVTLAEPTNVQQYVPRGIFVQIGAFDKNNSKIREDINFLSKVGVVTLQNIDINGKNILRVRVGPYGSIEDAAKVKTSLARLGYKDPRVVIEE